MPDESVEDAADGRVMIQCPDAACEAEPLSILEPGRKLSKRDYVVAYCHDCGADRPFDIL